MRRSALALSCSLLLLAGCGSEAGSPDAQSPATPSQSQADDTGPLDSDSGSDSDSDSETQTGSAEPSPGAGSAQRPRVLGTVATGLEVPWGIDFLPDGSALVTERDSQRLLRIDDGRVAQVGTIEQAAPGGEGGVLGIAVSPTYAEDGYVFVYVTTSSDNRIIRYRFDDGASAGDALSEESVILDGIPNGFIHDGGRLEFGPDGHLYASTGEAGEPDLAQDPDSLGGKILRITADGEPAPDNPEDGSPVLSWGHRNIQGLAFDDAGQLWASEFGASDFDELNRVEAGGNHGWPLVEGRGGNGEYVEPQAVWPTSQASPSGLAHLEGSLWMAGLRGQRLWQVPLNGEEAGLAEAGKPRGFFVGEYGRLRTVVVAPDGNLWVTTSNRDGRGDPAADDDQILEVAVR